MRMHRLFLVVVVSATALGLVVSAKDEHSGKTVPRDSAFERIKALNGEWEARSTAHEHGDGAATVAYKVTSGGNAVLETLFAGSEHEMITLYYQEGEDLALTHYCMFPNRPHMRAERGSSADKIVFVCAKGENAEIEKEDHMHQATFTFADNDHVKIDWVLFKGGKESATHSWDLSRKKK